MLREECRGPGNRRAQVSLLCLARQDPTGSNLHAGRSRERRVRIRQRSHEPRELATALSSGSKPRMRMRLPRVTLCRRSGPGRAVHGVLGTAARRRRGGAYAYFFVFDADSIIHAPASPSLAAGPPASSLKTIGLILIRVRHAAERRAGFLLCGQLPLATRAVRTAMRNVRAADT